MQSTWNPRRSRRENYALRNREIETTGHRVNATLISQSEWRMEEWKKVMHSRWKGTLLAPFIFHGSWVFSSCFFFFFLLLLSGALAEHIVQANNKKHDQKSDSQLHNVKWQHENCWFKAVANRNRNLHYAMICVKNAHCSRIHILGGKSELSDVVVALSFCWEALTQITNRGWLMDDALLLNIRCESMKALCWITIVQPTEIYTGGRRVLTKTMYYLSNDLASALDMVCIMILFTIT